MLLKDAMDIAMPIWESLKPVCDIRKIAGSIRREKPEPKDIEIVCLPKVVVLKDMFGWDEGTIREPLFHKIVSELGRVIKGNTDGKYMQIALPQGINLDLFMPDETDLWRQFAIRTGSGEWTTKYIAGGWKSIGWCGSDVGLRLQSQCEGKKGPDGKTKWRFNVSKSEEVLPPHWKSEQEFFDWIKLKWVEPKLRNI